MKKVEGGFSKEIGFDSHWTERQKINEVLTQLDNLKDVEKKNPYGVQIVIGENAIDYFYATIEEMKKADRAFIYYTE